MDFGDLLWFLAKRGIHRPLTGRNGLQGRRALAQSVTVNPKVRQHPLDEYAGFPRRQALDEEQRVA